MTEVLHGQGQGQAVLAQAPSVLPTGGQTGPPGDLAGSTVQANGHEQQGGDVETGLQAPSLVLPCSLPASCPHLSLLLILIVHMQASPSKEEVPSVANEPIGIITIEDVFEE